MTKKRYVTHCADWATDKNGVPYPKKGVGGNITPADQSFGPASDINFIINKAKREGVLSHVNANAQFYADMTDFNYEAAREQIAQAQTTFYELDSEIRAEFDNDYGKFANWAAARTPEQIVEEIPALAAPGRQFPDVVGGQAQQAPSPPAEEPAPPSNPGGEAAAEPATQ